jgi:hypothetical protein
MLLDKFPPMTGAASPNRVDVVDGGKDQHGREVVSVVTERYRSAKRAEKGRMLDALCATTGWHRKHAVRALRQRETVAPGEVGAPHQLLLGRAQRVRSSWIECGASAC